MNKVTQEQVLDVADKLLNVASVFDPKDVALVKTVFQIGKQLNDLINRIKTQTELESPEVWQQIRGDYEEAVKAFEQINPEG